MVGIVWIPATTTSFLCLRQFVWWESPGVRCRGFFVCGYGRGVLLLGLFPPRNRTEEQRNACAHHISRRAQAHAGPARECRGRRAARREGPTRRGRRHRPGAPVREGHGPVRQMWGAWPAVRPAGCAPLAASRHRLRQAPAGARAPEGRLRGARGDRRDGAVARRKSAYTSDFERQVAWLSVHAPRSAVSALMRVDWKSVGPICRRVPLGHRGVLEARREDRRRRFDILRTIRSGLSNARLEAVNNKIKTTIKMGYGYRNLGNLIALVMLKCGGRRPVYAANRGTVSLPIRGAWIEISPCATTVTPRSGRSPSGERGLKCGSGGHGDGREQVAPHPGSVD